MTTVNITASLAVAAAAIAISVSGTPQRTFGDFWAGWCEASGMPTKVVQQPIATVPPQSEPDLQLDAPFKLQVGDTVSCDQPAGVFRPCRCGSTKFACAACHKGGRWLSRQHLIEEVAS